MVIPWVGFPARRPAASASSPTSRAKYVEFTTLLDPKQMPGQRRGVLHWPYVEGLRIDEAMHPLALHGGRRLRARAAEPERRAAAPASCRGSTASRAASRSSRIRFTEQQPATTWALAAPDEYGFYANVNPTVDHPRWSQATERRIGEGFFAPRAPDADVQRLRRPGRGPVPGHGPAPQLLSMLAAMPILDNADRRYRLLYKPLLFVACLVPLAWTVAGVLGPAGAQPRRRSRCGACSASFGHTALNLLLLTLSITPLRQLTGKAQLLRLRRMLGRVRLQLRAAAFHDVRRSVPGLQRCGDRQGPHQAPLHHDRVPGTAAADAAGRHLDQCDDAPAQAPLAAACTGWCTRSRSLASGTTGGRSRRTSASR